MIKTIIFDWGGVLIKYPTDNLMSYWAGKLGTTPDKLNTQWKKYETSFQKGLLSEKKLWQEICKSLNIAEPTEKSLWLDGVKKVFTDNHAAWNILKNLKNKGYKIGLLSNTELPTIEYFEQKNYAQYFDATVFSCLEGMTKPQPEIYKLICERLAVRPSEAIFIGDNKQNVKGADKFGLHAILFQDEIQLKKDLNFIL